MLRFFFLQARALFFVRNPFQFTVRKSCHGSVEFFLFSVPTSAWAIGQRFIRPRGRESPGTRTETVRIVSRAFTIRDCGTTARAVTSLRLRLTRAKGRQSRQPIGRGCFSPGKKHRARARATAVWWIRALLCVTAGGIVRLLLGVKSWGDSRWESK